MGININIVGFSNAALEARFWERSAEQSFQGDAKVCFVLAGIWVLGSLYMALRCSAFLAGLQLAAWSAAVWLLVQPLAHFAPATYQRHRRLVVLAQRCACVLLPTVADLAVRLAPDVQLPPSLSSTLSIVVFSSQITTMWALALGLRLRLRDHLFPHALFAADVVLRQAPALCSAPFISNPTSLQGFSRLADMLTSTLLLPPLCLSNPPGWQACSVTVACMHCQALVAATHIVFGAFLSTFAVYVIEQRSRAEFLQAVATDTGWHLGQLPGQLGLSVDEFVDVFFFDSMGAWGRCLCLAPLLLLLTWLAVLKLWGASPAG